jgi:hypothetical protein
MFQLDVQQHKIIDLFSGLWAGEAFPATLQIREGTIRFP